jgi:glycosyltransferase involved in cell wall biosynthesis
MPPDSVSESPRPWASVITPTFGRPEMLPQAYKAFSTQTIDQIEWVVVDDSAQESAFMTELADPRVRYIYLPARLSTGEKRNIAVDASSADIIVHFDDDDYYAPVYIKTMIDYMTAEKADFVKLSAFFLYSRIHEQYGYWDLQQKDGAHFVWSSNPEVSLIRFQDNAENRDRHLGYGFSYVFKKEVWETTHFLPVFWNQDTPFIKSAIDNGFKIALLADQAGICLHVLHENNVSASFPQYILPSDRMHDVFKGLDAAFL